jgi:peptidoglycan/xylan/chitin deacetylase (PgdA/CDA1 family)
MKYRYFLSAFRQDIHMKRRLLKSGYALLAATLILLALLAAQAVFYANEERACSLGNIHAVKSSDLAAARDTEAALQEQIRPFPRTEYRALSADAALNSDNAGCKHNEVGSNQRILTVLMYHSFLSKPRGKYVCTPKIFEEDLLEAKARGYTTVFPSEVIRWVENGGDFPDKPLLITMDDGHYNNLYYCKPLLEKHGCKAVVHVVGAFSNYSEKSGDHSKASYSYLTWGQIRELNDGKTFEIGNHTYNMHKFSPRNGIARKKGEGDDEYVRAITADITRLQNKLTLDCGVTPVCFAYPFGIFNKTAKNALLDMGFKMLFNCTEKRNLITQGDPGTLHAVCRFNRAADLSSRAFFDKTERSIT